MKHSPSVRLDQSNTLTDHVPYNSDFFRNCDAVDELVALVSGGLSGDHENQDAVIVLNDKKVCSQPFFWSNMSVMPRHRWGHVSTFMESLYVVCGGTTQLDGLIGPNNTCDAFNLSSRAWEEFDDMLELRHQVRLPEYQGRVNTCSLQASL